MNKLFIWIPKTGGTSASTDGGLRVITDNYHTFTNEGDVTFGHADIREVLRHGYMTKEYWDSCYRFTLVRNPYTRFISLWKDFVQSKRTMASPEEFAHILLHSSRKIGLYNAIDYSQCAAQVDWIVPHVEILRLEDRSESLPKLNAGRVDEWQTYYTPNLYSMVNQLYYDDFTILGYNIHK